jgi:type VI secretion system protein ImpA
MPFRDDLLEAIPGENPSGKSLRYAPVYDKIKESRREEDDVPQGDWKHERKTADFAQVIKLAGEALAKESKDLQLAVWLTEAALRTSGIDGLKEGLDLLRGLVERFWDTLYPEIEDGDLELRAAPLEWVGARLEGAIRGAPLTRSGLDWFKYKESRAVGTEAEANESTAKAEARAAAIEEGKITAEEFDKAFDATPKAFYKHLIDSLDGTLASADSLGSLCGEKFGDLAPNFGGLRSTLEELHNTCRILLNKKLETDPDEEAAPGVEETVAEEVVEAPAVEIPAAVVRPAAPRKAQPAEPADREDAFRRVAAAARFLRREDAYNPAPYLLLRGLRWGELRAGGASVDAALLEPPSTEVRQKLKRLSLDGQWQEVLEAAETAMESPAGRGWLDLQRYACRACENLGGNYDAILTAVRSELKTLLADYPQLSEMTLMDDTPTANAETQAWLREIATPAPAEPEAPSFAAYLPPEAASPSAYELALDAARSGHVEDAFDILSREIDEQRSGRARFQARLQLAQLCMATGREEIARPILEELTSEIDRHLLEQWEAPDTVAHPLVLLLRCIGKMGGEADEKRKLYARISRLDPKQALGCPH